MEEVAELFKKVGKAIVNSLAKTWKILLPSTLIIALIAGGLYIFTKYIAKRVTETSSTFFEDIKLSGREFSSGMSAEELWDLMIKKGYEVDKYLSSPTELKKLLEAELVTQLPDTREDVTKPIDWDSIFTEKDNIEKNKDSNSKVTGKINVLFVGNSKTYVNELPTQFQQLAESLGKEVYAVRTYEAWGARTLNSFLDEDGPSQDFKQRVSETKWDYVVLQEQTDASLSSSQLTQGATRIIDYIKQNSNENVIPIYAAWSVLGDFNESDYNQATQNYETAKSQTGGKVAYIAKSMLQCHSEYPSIKIFQDDNLHPEIAGTYLAACCVYKTIYGENTEGASFKFGLPDETATNIQKVVDQVQKNSSYSSNKLQGIIKFKRHDTNGNEYYLTYAEPDEFSEYMDSYNSSSSSEEQKKAASDFVLTHFTLKKGTPLSTGSSTSTTDNNSTYNGSYAGQIDTSASGDGYDGTYVSSKGVVFKDYKQTKGSYAGNSYRGNTISSHGCLPTSISIIADAAGLNATPATVAAAIDCGYNDATQCYSNGLSYLRNNGISVTEVSSPSASDVLNWMSEGKVIIGYTNGGSKYSTGAHFFTIVDGNDKGQGMVLNPGVHGTGSGWFTPDEVDSAWVIDANSFPKSSNTNNSNNTTENNSNQNSNNTTNTTNTTGNTNSSKTNTTSSNKKNSNKTSANFTGQINTSEGGDGWYGTYTSHNGIKYKDYKQGSPAPWATHGGSYGGSIGSVGCAPSSLAIILSGTVNDSITPEETFDKLGNDGYTWGNATEAVVHGFSLYGMSAEKITTPTAQQILDLLKEGKVMVASLNASIFYGGPHAVAIVDVNTDTGEVFVMDPAGLTNSQWVTASYIESVDRYIVAADAGKGGITGSGSGSSKTTSISPGYQAVVATVSQIDRSTTLNGANAESAAEEIGVGIENGTSYLISQSTINYEALVQPYTLSFDLLWSFILIGQSKGFVMDWADLAYNSEIEIAILENQKIDTITETWSYKEITNIGVRGSVKYDKDGIFKEIDVGHMHTELVDEPPIKEENGAIFKNIINRNTTANAEISKAHTWIINYDVEYERNHEKDDTVMQERDLDDQELENWNRVSIKEDTCGKIDTAIDDIVKYVNEQYRNSQQKVNESQATTLANGAKIASQTKAKEIDKDDKNIDLSNVRVTRNKERKKIKDNTISKEQRKTYTQRVAKIEIKDTDTNKTISKSKTKTAESTKPQQTQIQNLDNFLFIGDSRYDGVEDINQLGNNIKNLGVGSARVDEWVNVVQNGGRGTVQGRFVDVTGGYSGISIQLGANSLWKGADRAASEMKDLIDGLKKIHPSTAIIVNSCLPDTDYLQSEIYAFNNAVKNYCDLTDNAYYIDISTNLVNSSGYIKGEYTQDGCHLSSSEATRIFAENIRNGALGKSSSTSTSSNIEENFISLFNKRKYKQNKNNILSATQWLFQILQENNKTKNIVTTIKYLLYKATGTSYGVTEFPEDLFNPNNFQNAQTGSSGSGVTNDLISFIEAMEGAGEKSGEDYVVYYTSIDGCLNVGAGVVVKFGDGSTRFTEIIGEPHEGQIVTKAQYQQMFNQEFKEITDVLDTELATQGVTLKSYQRDAMISYLYNVGTGYTSKIVTAYKNGGDEGFWNAIKDSVHSVTGQYLLGLERRRQQEYKLFTTGVYEWPY